MSSAGCPYSRDCCPGETTAVYRMDLLGSPRTRLRRSGCSIVCRRGLAPAAHGGNRTGRIFTGDRSGDWLYHALRSVWVCEPVPSRCTRVTGSAFRPIVTLPPPCAARRPTTNLRQTSSIRCRPYLIEELRLLRQPTRRSRAGESSF